MVDFQQLQNMSYLSRSFSKYVSLTESTSGSYRSDSTVITGEYNSRPDIHGREKIDFDFEPITEEVTVCNTSSDDHSNSFSRISGDFVGRSRFSNLIDLKQLLPLHSEKETAKDLPKDNAATAQQEDFEVPVDRSRAKAFCANLKDLLPKPAANIANSFDSLESTSILVPEESKSFENSYYKDFTSVATYFTTGNFSNCDSFLEREIPYPDQLQASDIPRGRELSHSDDIVELLQIFRKSSSRRCSEMLILRKSYSCSNIHTEDTNQINAFAKFYQCDYKIYIDGKEFEKSVTRKPARRHSGVKLDTRNSIHVKKVYNLKESQAYAYVSQTFQASRRENIIDHNKLEERISSDPFIILASKKHENKENLHTQDFTDIQWISSQKLIDEIISPPKEDINFEEKRARMKKTLIMAYDVAFSSLDLFEQLMRRFFIPSPTCMSPTEAIFFEASVKEPAQMRVLELLLYWMREREADFLENLALRQVAMAYLKVAACVCTKHINEKLKEIKNFLDLGFEHERALSLGKTIDVIDRSVISLPSNPKSCEKWYVNDSKTYHLGNATKILFDFSPRETAEQMTLIDSALHKDIRHWHIPHNLRNKIQSNFAQGKEGHDSPYRRLIEQMNFRTFFFVYLIIAQKTEQKKLLVIVRLLEIAKNCVKIQNFQGHSCIMGALTNMAVISQKIAWDQMPYSIQKRRKRYEYYYKHSQKLRTKIREAVPPLVPCLMTVSLDLEKIMSVPVYLEDSKRLINFRSMEEIRLATEKFFSSQKSEFNYQPIHQLLEYFQVEVLRLMVLLSSDLNITKLQAHLQSIAMKARSK